MATPGSPPSQLPFDLPVRPALQREDFLVAPANAVAVRWIDRWPDWPGSFLAVHGPQGCGKTHLVQVWAARSGARVLSGAELREAAVPGIAAGRHVAIDDADRIREPRALLHLHNLIGEQRGTLLLAARPAPATWPVPLADLRSRLGAMQSVPIAAPDDALFAAVLVKLFRERQLGVGADVIDYLVARLERSFAAAQNSVAIIDRLSLAAGRGITVRFLSGIAGHLPGVSSCDPGS